MPPTLHRSVVDRLPRPTIEERRRLAEDPSPSPDKHAAALDALGVFSAVEVGGEVRSEPHQEPLRIAAFNVERGTQIDGIASLLEDADADVVLLSEVDVGMARSGQRHVAEELGERLDMAWSFAVEFVELGAGGPEEAARVGDEPNAVGFHGGAILTRLPVVEATVLRIEMDGTWFGPRPPGVPVEPRIGGRIAVLAVLDLGGVEIVVVAPHLESHGGPDGRCDQLMAVIDAAEDLRPGAPVVIGGDLNTSTLGPEHFGSGETLASALDGGPERFLFPQAWEPLFAAAERRGYDWVGGFNGVPTARVTVDLPPTMALDWFLTRGMQAGSTEVVSAVSGSGCHTVAPRAA